MLPPRSAARGDREAINFSAQSVPASMLVPSPSACGGGRVERGVVVRCWCVVGVVGATTRRINLPQLHSHTSGVLHGGVSEVMTSCVCRSLRLANLGFMDGVGEAAATPSVVSLLLLCPRCCGVLSDVMVEQEGCVVQEYVQTNVCTDDSWKMVYPVLGLWMEVDSYDVLFRRRSRMELSVLEFDGVSRDMLP